MRSDLRTRQEVVAHRLGLLAGETGQAPPVPETGRHAERRRWLPVPLRGTVALDPWHLVVVVAVLAVALAACCWWLLRRAPTLEPVAAPALSSASALTPMAAASGGAPPVSPSGGASPSGVVTVDIAGKVRRPGVRRLPAGSRVVDALRVAGGVRRGVDLSGLNQARILVDGEQILVGVRGAAPAGPGEALGPQAAAGAGALVNLNTATAAQLDTLPGVGPVTAQAILDYRTQHGGFGSVGELLEVDGIGDATLAKIEPHVTV